MSGTADGSLDWKGLPVSHANAALTSRHRLKVARMVVEDGYPISEVAALFQCSWPTVKRWVDRYLWADPFLRSGCCEESSCRSHSRAGGLVTS